MSLIHQKLYAGENFAIIEMEDYFINLANSLLESYGVEDHIQMKYEVKLNWVQIPLFQLV